jgi:hypothetical protein
MGKKDPAKLSKVGIDVDFGIFKLSTEWTEDPRQRDAAWALYVEYGTRISTQALDIDDGLIAEALDSLHALFGVTREVLREEGPVVGAGQGSVGGIAMTVLNKALRPFLSRWHPRLAEWQATHGKEGGPRAVERQWPDEIKCRAELAKLSSGMVAYANALARIAGAEGATEE